MNWPILFQLIALPISQVRVLPSGADANLVSAIAEFKPGMEYSEAQVPAAIRKLYASGYFDYVAIDTSLVDSKIQLTIQVEQPPRLDRLEIVGNRKIKTQNILKELKVDSGTVLTCRQLFDWERIIRGQYKKKNYLLVNVSTRLVETDRPGYALARVEIEEGRGVHINTISFVGNENFKSIRLERLMKNRPKWFILRSGRFDEQKFNRDIETIEGFYHDRGWIDAEVSGTELPIDSLGRLDIVIHIDEGRRFFTGGFSFQGREVLAESTLTKAVVLEKGKPYSLSMAKLSLDRLRRAYWEEGYIYAQVEPVENLRVDTVDVTYQIREGEPAKVRRVVIEGNRSVNDNAIRREIMLLPGSIFKYSLVERSQRNIYNMDLFSDVRFYPKELGDGTGNIDLVFSVVEKQSGQISAGVNLGTQGKTFAENISGNVKIVHPNVFGGAEQGTLLLEKGALLGEASISLIEPWFFDTPTLLGGELYYRTRIYDLYDSKGTAFNRISWGGSVQTSRPLPLDYTHGGLVLRAERVNIDSVSKKPFPTDPIFGFDPESYPKTTISLTLRLTRDSRDYFVNPSSGSYVNQSLQFAGAPLPEGVDFLGDVDFIKELFEVHMNFPIAWERNIVLTQKMKLGYLTGYTPADTIPVYERFRPGGTSYDGVVRGYDDLSLGTKVSGALLGGRALAVFNTELKVKVTPQLALIGFFDAGEAWESLGQVNFAQLKKGVGAGIRFEIPLVGVMGFDAGFGLDYPPGTPLSQRFRPHFQISRTF